MITREHVIMVAGHPKPKGSLKCIGRPGSFHRLVEDNKDTKPYRDLLAGWFRKTPERADPQQPIAVSITSTVVRPGGHYGTGRNADVVKASAPTYPATKSSYDADKLARLVCDALQDAEVVVDDAQIVEVLSRKAYPGTDVPDALDHPGVVVRIRPYVGQPTDQGVLL